MKSDSDENEEQFYKKLEEEAKEGKVDLEKMTRRQRMAYMATQKKDAEPTEAMDIDDNNKAELLDL